MSTASDTDPPHDAAGTGDEDVHAWALGLGPTSVVQQAIDMQLAYEADDKEAQQRAEASFILAAQQTLVVPRQQRPRSTPS